MPRVLCAMQRLRPVRRKTVSSGLKAVYGRHFRADEASGVATILATGGNAMVEAAYSCGKPALGVGRAMYLLMLKNGGHQTGGARYCDVEIFDNGMVCASEQAVIADKEILQRVGRRVQILRRVLCQQKRKAMLEEFIFGVTANCASWRRCETQSLR